MSKQGEGIGRHPRRNRMKRREIRIWLAALFLGAIFICIGHFALTWAATPQNKVIPTSQNVPHGSTASFQFQADDDVPTGTSKVTITIPALGGAGQFIAGNIGGICPVPGAGGSITDSGHTLT